jgi:hypothetical protein
MSPTVLHQCPEVYPGSNADALLPNSILLLTSEFVELDKPNISVELYGRYQ